MANRRYRRISFTPTNPSRLAFPRYPITLPPFLPTFVSFRWIDDDDCEPLPRRSSHNYNPITRRKIAKRYSDIVGPCSSKNVPTFRERYSHSSTNIHRRHTNERIVPRKKSRDHHDFNQINNKSTDFLAHRMQAAMSSDLMNSLDRKKFLKRSQTFHSYSIVSQPLIPRAKLSYQQTFIRRIENKTNHKQIKEEEEEEEEEEPEIDYDQEENILKNEPNTLSDLPAASASFIVPALSKNNTEEQITSLSDLQTLPDLNNEEKKSTFHCRTIADRLTPDHKLILKDNEDNKSDSSKAITLQKSPITQSNNSPIEDILFYPKTFINNNEQHLASSSSSSPTISIPIDHESEHRSTSSKIYRDYKQRTYLTDLPTSLHRHASLIIEPIHTKIGLRSSTASSPSSNDKIPDMTLISKQMNVCVINQLNEHLSTRFRQYEQSQIESSSSSLNNKNSSEHQNYDLPPELMSNQNHQQQTNIYNQTSIPPPPPPLPVGGFPPIKPPDIRSINSQRLSTMTVTCETTNSDHLSIASSNLSDTRILRELRENPLFTRAKQHLEIQSLTNNTSSRNELETTETVTYVRLEHCVKPTSIESRSKKQELETIIMLPNELNSIIGKRTKSTTDLQQIKTRSCSKLINQSPTCHQSELEMIFQKRAQRSVQNLT